MTPRMTSSETYQMDDVKKHATDENRYPSGDDVGNFGRSDLETQYITPVTDWKMEVNDTRCESIN